MKLFGNNFEVRNMLQSWELTLYQLSVGSLLSGILLFVFSMYTTRFHIKFIKHQKSSTPIILLLASFLLMFGAVGYSIYQSQLFDPYMRLIMVIFLPIIFVLAINYVWGRYTGKYHGIEIPTVAIDNQVRTLTDVDELGGLVLADTGTYDRPETLRLHEKMKMQAKTLPGTKIDRDSIAYIIDIDAKNTLIIDLWPKIAKKENST